MEGDYGINAITLRICASTKEGKGITALDGVNNHELGRLVVSVGAGEEGQFMRELLDGSVEFVVIKICNR